MNKSLFLIVALVTVSLQASQMPSSKFGTNPPRRPWQGWGKTERRQEPQGPRYERNIPGQTRDMSTPTEKRAPQLDINGTRKGHRRTGSVSPGTQDRPTDVMPPRPPQF